MQIGSNNDDVVTKMLLDTSGGIIIAGETLGGLDSYTNAGGRDLFVIKLNPSGSVQWTMQRGSSGDEYASSLQLDSADTIYLAGDTSGDLDGNSNTGGRDAYIIKLTSLGAWTSTLQIGSGQDDRLNKESVSSDQQQWRSVGRIRKHAGATHGHHCYDNFKHSDIANNHIFHVDICHRHVYIVIADIICYHDQQQWHKHIGIQHIYDDNYAEHSHTNMVICDHHQYLYNNHHVFHDIINTCRRRPSDLLQRGRGEFSTMDVILPQYSSLPIRYMPEDVLYSRGITVGFRRIHHSHEEQQPLIPREAVLVHCRSMTAIVLSSSAYEYYSNWVLAAQYAHLDLELLSMHNTSSFTGLLPKLWGLQPTNTSQQS
ncbi:hypothetical protein AK812_SmicGene16720 [Symbiodinium microadriaticum]|uniref:Uncharacterized protein n=1 Tax=Symbiodinium microadriaticum TaxID=2951 RepID=A0A1Q9DZM0_SYMMI|nr:hypothetical protein AK812_SmicGene16720 [Symbiodinium microadriaticum]CAE7777872.1 unnamed protein product [Symbiodinium microadriaticum]